MNFFLQFVVVLLLVMFLHFINQLLVMKKNDIPLQWKSILVLFTISLVITLLFNIPSSLEYGFPL
ncbi:hypothetical protein [Lysinibacillus sp. 38-6]|uniref:hypothetical protein n=1 Tax=Lysinibacillus sp. 38-6 TaxID=3385991 RepID=UPI003908AF14